MPFEHSAGILVFRIENSTRHFLLLHYRSGHWDFPKGHLEKGETAAQAALRELREETGIRDVALLHGFQEKMSYAFTQRKRHIFKEVTFFVGETKTSRVRLSHEHRGFVWLPFEAAVKKATFATAKDMLQKAQECLGHHGN